MWTYSQTTGALAHDGCAIGTGYSGHGDGLDNPAMEAVHSVGPLPRGPWRIGAWHDHPHLGPCVAALTPIGHAPHCRSAFFIHGDNSAANHTASDGCIVLGPLLRQAMALSADTCLEVTT
jgi:Protein of unknown function (DUF2778)